MLLIDHFKSIFVLLNVKYNNSYHKVAYLEISQSYKGGVFKFYLIII